MQPSAPIPVNGLDDTASGKHGRMYDPEGAKQSSQDSPISTVTAHDVGQDSPWEVGAHLIAALDNAFILGYPFLIMSFLGWGPGVVLFILFGILSFYCNCLLCQLHNYGGTRHVRYRDLAKAVFGPAAYWITWFLQWLNLLCANVGLVVLCGECLKGTFELYSDKYFSLAEWIVVAGAAIGAFAVCVPNLHYLRIYSTISCILVFVFTIIVVAVSCHDGRNNKPHDYSLYGSRPTKAFDAMGAFGSMAFAYNTVILPEIQATVRAPAVRNMTRKTLPLMYSIGSLAFLLISFVCYWAYGNGIEPNVIQNLSGPSWAVALAYIAGAAQIVVSFHIYACPIYEAMDTPWGKGSQSKWSLWNVSERFVTRTIYLVLTTFVAALLPFFGDFIALTGSLSVLPLDFVLVLAMTMKVKGRQSGLFLNGIHSILLVLLAAITVVSSISAVRYIVVDSVNYNVFANLSV